MKRFIKAILWIGCYGGACWFGIKSKLGFDILNNNHWQLLLDRSLVHAPWPVDMASKRLVCKVLLAFIIVGVLGLAVVTKKKKSRIPVVKDESPNTADQRPAPIASQGRVTVTPVAAAVPPPSVPTPPATPIPNSTVPATPSISNLPPISPMSDAIRKISAIANNFDISVFPHVKLENTFTQLVISDDSTALLLKILPQLGTWQMEQAERPEDSLWTIGNDPPKNILKDIIDSTATLARLEPEAHAIAVVIVAGGTIENALEVKNYLEQNGIRIAVLQNETMPDLPDWHHLLSEFYPLKQKENNNETNTNS